MDKALSYTNHFGDRVEFGDASGVHLTDYADVHARSWDYDELNSKITSMRHKTRTLSLSVYIDVGSNGLAVRDALCDLLEADSMANVDGKLSTGGWSMPCRSTESSVDGWWADDNVLHDDLKLVSTSPVWTRDVERHYATKTAESDTPMHSGYPYPYPHGLLSSAVSDTVTNSTVGDCNFCLRIFGPVANPYVIIGGNRHELDATLSAGERAEIDTRDKTAIKTAADGTETNVYSSLKMGGQSSTSYPFRKLTRGDSTVVWDGTFAFDIVQHEERSEPAWS